MTHQPEDVLHEFPAIYNIIHYINRISEHKKHFLMTTAYKNTIQSEMKLLNNQVKVKVNKWMTI